MTKPQSMPKQAISYLTPRLRFPEFRNEPGWSETLLGELGELVSGLTYSPNDVRDEGLLVLRSSNIQNDRIDLSDCVFVDPSVKGANLSEPDDILICVRNGSKALIGKNVLIPKGLPVCTHGAFMTVFRSPVAKFVFQLFQTPAYQKQVAADLGATINSINGGQLLRYRFCIPKPPEQQKITSFLTSLDELIAAEDQKLNALKAHKKGLMQQLFPREGENLPQLRFPEFQNAPDWSTVELGDLLSCKPEYGVNAPAVPHSETLPTYLRITDIDEDGRFLGGTKASVDIVPTDENYLSEGDIVLARTGASVGKSYRYRGVDGPLVFAGFLIRIRANPSRLNPVFLSYLLNTDQYWKWIGIKSVRSGQPGINGSEYASLRVSVPADDNGVLLEQQKIATCLSSLDELIVNQGKKIETLRIYKKGLMQLLFPSPGEVES